MALRNWHDTTKKCIKQNRQYNHTHVQPATPSHHLSPVHLLRHQRSEINSNVDQTTPAVTTSTLTMGVYPDGFPSPSLRQRRRRRICIPPRATSRSRCGVLKTSRVERHHSSSLARAGWRRCPSTRLI
ncbi:hypothetical protein RHGRI_005794 [Rhododendron griersonianum]|uniref:Uncharacterized protein n=1 Tax=Rhododendron griersonianum TaxID=479676 RepID=A0AAV6LDJ7_9ERIC|nr:hypothetical protein RHGRI_005794 [Rhododendron griersonianum]